MQCQDCRTHIQRGKRGPAPTRCPDCRRKRDTNRKRASRKPQNPQPDLYAEPDPDLERWGLVLERNDGLWVAHQEGLPFETQVGLWAEQLYVQRHPDQDPFAGPRPCSHAIIGGSIIHAESLQSGRYTDCTNPLAAGTLIWSFDNCPSCGHMLGPEPLTGSVSSEVCREYGLEAPVSDTAFRRFRNHAGRPHRCVWRGPR